MARYDVRVELGVEASLDLGHCARSGRTNRSPALRTSPSGGVELVLRLSADSVGEAVEAALAEAADAVPDIAPVGVRVRMVGCEEIDDEPELVSVTQAAVRLGISRQAVLRRITSGALPATKIGATYAVSTAALPKP